MSANPPTHYEVLGVPSTATQQEIKRRYRELARKHHPDIAPSPDAAARFREINEANSVLSDPARRASYDAELTLKARLNVRTAQPSQTSTRTTANQNPSTPGAARPAQRPNDPTTQRPTPPRRPPNPDSIRLLDEARRALTRMKYREADELCREALKLDRRNSGAYELLGDIHLKRGRDDEALAMFSYAIQLDRGNRSAQMKLDRLTGRPSGATMAGTAARATRGGAVRAGALERTQRTFNAVALGLVGFMLYVVGSTRQPTAHSPWIFEWDSLLVLALAVSGLSVGFTMALNGWIERAQDVLSSSRRAQPGKPGVPLGFVLGGFSLVLFHGSAALYLILGSLQGRLNRSLLGTYVATYVVISLFALAGHVAGPYILLFGGNIVFVTFLVGWVLGDRIRETAR